MLQHTIVSNDEWLSARRARLSREKALTRKMDTLAETRRAPTASRRHDDGGIRRP